MALIERLEKAFDEQDWAIVNEILDELADNEKEN